MEVEGGEMSESNLEALFDYDLNVMRLSAGMVREHKFHPVRKWRFDFAWPALMVAVEIEGGVWSNGRHTRGSGFVADAEKYAEALLMGWRVLRIPGEWVTDGRGVRYTEMLLASVNCARQTEHDFKNTPASQK